MCCPRPLALFHRLQVSPTGRYTVELFSVESDAWVAIEVDDYIPAEFRNGNPRPVFSQVVLHGRYMVVTWPLHGRYIVLRRRDLGVT